MIKFDQLSTMAGKECTVFNTDRRPSFASDVKSLLREDMHVIFAMFSLDEFLPKKSAFSTYLLKEMSSMIIKILARTVQSSEESVKNHVLLYCKHRHLATDLFYLKL